MTDLQLILVFAIPCVAALQRFAVAYGYEGQSKEQALGGAFGVFTMLLLFCLCCVVYSGL